jgi:hypothetical protein
VGKDRKAGRGIEASRLPQLVLVAATLAGSWLGMQAVHELGHFIGAWFTGARVVRVELPPWGFSRTEIAGGSVPVLVLAAGPVLGVLLPLAAWSLWRRARWPGGYLLRFFAGFCLIANGAYIGAGSFGRVEDAGELLSHGAPAWSLWAFGIVAVAAGLRLWHGEGAHFGLGAAQGRVSPRAAYIVAAVVLLWAVSTVLLFGGPQGSWDAEGKSWTTRYDGRETARLLHDRAHLGLPIFPGTPVPGVRRRSPV